MFYLFQDGVVRETLQLNSGTQSLLMDNNVQEMALQLSIPSKSVRLTVIGCGLLCLGAIFVAAYSVMRRGDPLATVSTPQGIAQVMVGETTYPPWVLHRKLVAGSDREDADAFVVGRISLNNHQSKKCVEFDESMPQTASSNTSSESSVEVTEIDVQCQP
ncbi:hypothetical protein Poli38472_004649 [Pythium oligandrum]|uniref:Uncharacterized protein n=1 Tax=Pythium oligandrum TaxID=41045 RepID=A0A8K1FDM5_PYTOL|nr:hypothetical protein Poli38472_004649 [Pythium oligandrum]|eukprot:TMW59580.1 hypothetical protein Poli38472_004649 [Pythium oligandrum]